MLSHSSCDTECGFMQANRAVTLVTRFSGQQVMCVRACTGARRCACVHMRG
jgi:hypothetical protein